MSSPIYCILSAGTVHCVPVTTFSTGEPTKLARTPVINYLADLLAAPRPQGILAIKNRNLLYTLNNPLLSDLESDVSRRLSTSDNSDDELLPAKVVVPRVRLPAQNIPRRSDSLKRGQLEINILEDETPGPDVLTILNDYATHAVYLPQYSVDLQTNLDTDYTQIKLLLSKVFPSWSGDIMVKQLTGGITNMLLMCLHPETSETLLMRVYGKGTNLIIDRNREFVLQLVLNALDLAPQIYARFSNGLIYGFLPGRSLEYTELANPAIYPYIAQQLGRWHDTINGEYIEDGVTTLRKYQAAIKTESAQDPEHKASKAKSKKKSVNDLWDLIEDWILIVPANEALVRVFGTKLNNPDVTIDNIRDVVFEEFQWLKQALRKAKKSPIVVSHCDLLSGNIIVPEEFDALKPLEKLPPVSENPVQFIDYEYMLRAPRAFDIANHFAEWQGFDCKREAIPDPSAANPVMRQWCRGYLDDMDASDEDVDLLIEEIACYYGLPGFYWGIWAMIQSELSTIDFNYAEYSELRLEEYWLWKAKFTSKE